MRAGVRYRQCMGENPNKGCLWHQLIPLSGEDARPFALLCRHCCRLLTLRFKRAALVRKAVARGWKVMHHKPATSGGK